MGAVWAAKTALALEKRNVWALWALWALWAR